MSSPFISTRVFRHAFLWLLPFAMLNGPAMAETYVAGQFGGSFPQKSGTDAEVSGGGFGPGTQAGDPVFRNSYLFGAKLGRYFESVKWFGLETEVFVTSPDLKQQSLIVTPPAPAPTRIVAIAGQTVNVITWATNLAFRMPGSRFEPYGNVGIGVFFARLYDGQSGTSRSSVQPGLNLEAGGRYRFTEHVSLFGEWKFNYVRLDFDPTSTLLGLSATLATQNLVIGVGYHF